MKNAEGDASRAFGESSRGADEPPAGPGVPNRARTNRRRERRRQIERVVTERGEPLTIDALTDLVMEWELDRSDGSLARSDLREQLYEVDLPSLERRGALTLEADHGLVRAPDASEVETDREKRFGRYYAIAIGLSMGLFGLSRAAVDPFAMVSPSVTTAASLILVTFVAMVDRVKRLR